MIERSGDHIYILIRGEVCSKANSRRMMTARSKTGRQYLRPVKSDKAILFVNAAHYQVPVLKDMLEGQLCAHIKIFYPSERNDLDESLVLDVLQGRIYANDRQVRERHVYHGIDKNDPRVEIVLGPIDSKREVVVLDKGIVL